MKLKHPPPESESELSTVAVAVSGGEAASNDEADGSPSSYGGGTCALLWPHHLCIPREAKKTVIAVIWDRSRC